MEITRENEGPVEVCDANLIGKQSGKTVLLLPGLIKSNQSFEYFAYIIALKGYKVVVPPE